MVAARREVAGSARKAAISASPGTTPTVSSVTRRRKVRSSVSGVSAKLATGNAGHAAPSLIHVFRISISLGGSGSPFAGITSSESALVMRRMIGLMSG